MADVPAKKVAEPAKKAEAKPTEPDEVVPDVSVVEYGAESEPKTGKSAEQAVKEAAASQVAATEAQDEAFADDPPRHVAATKVTNIQTPTGMVQRVDELAEQKPTKAGYETRSVGSEGWVLGYDVGDAVALAYTVRDDEGELANADTIALTVTKPDLTTATPTVANPPVETGLYEADGGYLFAARGRHLFRWVTTLPNTAETFEIYVLGAGNPLPTLTEVKDYLNSTQAGLTAQYSDAVITGAMDAETEAQRRRCRIPVDYPADLAEALKRRVHRNLAMRNLPLAVLQGDAEIGSPTLLPGEDPEVRRLERPHRWMRVG